MPDLISTDVHARDAVAQGRTVVIGVAVAFLSVWALSFLTYPVLLVPGFAYDRTLRTAFQLAGCLFQFGFFSVTLLFTWAGVGWMRYVLAAYLLVAGLFAIIVSMNYGSFGGVPLLLGAIELAAAVALATSVGVARFVEDQRRKGVPWLTLGFAIAGLFALVASLMLYDVVDAGLTIMAESRYSAVAADLMQKFAPDLDVHLLEDFATEKLKANLAAADVADGFKEERRQLGPLRSIDLPRPVTMANVLLAPIPGPARAYNATAHYQKGDVVISMEVDTSGAVPLLTDVYAQLMPENEHK